MGDLGPRKQGQEVQIINEDTQLVARVETQDTVTSGEGIRAYAGLVDSNGNVYGPSSPLIVQLDDNNGTASKVALWDGSSSNNVDVITDSDGKERLAVDIQGQAMDISEDPIFESVTFKKGDASLEENVITINANDPTGKDIFVMSITFNTNSNDGGIRFFNGTTGDEYVIRTAQAGSGVQHIFQKAIRILNGQTAYIALLGNNVCSKNADYFVSYDGFKYKV